jgi:hypothetical protein
VICREFRTSRVLHGLPGDVDTQQAPMMKQLAFCSDFGEITRSIE